MTYRIKQLALLSFLLCVLLFATSKLSFAQSVSSYNSGFQVVNLSSSTASVMIEYYNQDGTVESSVAATINGDDRLGVFPLPVTAGFNGSVVISSDQPVTAIASVFGNGNMDSSYTGFDTGSDTISLPLVFKDNWGIDTWFNVQNAGGSATTVTVSYAGTSCTETATIQPGAAATFDQSTNTCIPDPYPSSGRGYVNAASVTAGSTSDKIVATVIQTTPEFGLYAYNGFPGSGSTAPALPAILNNNFGIQTPAQIQNQGTSATSVTVSYSPSVAGTACTETRTIQPGESSTFALYAFTFDSQTTSTTCNMGERFVGAATVTANSTSQPLVAIVSHTDYNKIGSNYGSLDPASATDTVLLGQILDTPGWKIQTGFNVMNVGTSATVTCTFLLDTAGANTVSQTLGTNEVMTAVQLNSGLPSNVGGGYNGAATCTATAGGLLLGVANVNNYGSAADGFRTYEALNQ